jgi:hypothetical protein
VQHTGPREHADAVGCARKAIEGTHRGDVKGDAANCSA